MPVESWKRYVPAKEDVIVSVGVIFSEEGDIVTDQVCASTDEDAVKSVFISFVCTPL